MEIKNVFGIVLLFFCAIGLASCDSKWDYGSPGFMHVATVTGDSENGYYCYLDRSGEFVISYDARLEGIERGYFSFQYEEDWKITADNVMYLDNARVYPFTIYDVIYPISIEEAEREQITDADNCEIPPHFLLNYGYRGYFGISTGLSVVNSVDVSESPVEMNVVYDPAKQLPDTLFLQFYYKPRVPEEWTSTYYSYGSVSCDFSSLATLEQWSDSVTIVMEIGDKKKHRTKISKNDFLKPFM